MADEVKLVERFTRSLEVARRTHGTDTVQTRLSWADRFFDMRVGETLRLIDARGVTTVVTRDESGWLVQHG